MGLFRADGPSPQPKRLSDTLEVHGKCFVTFIIPQRTQPLESEILRSEAILEGCQMNYDLIMKVYAVMHREVYCTSDAEKLLPCHSPTLNA